MKFLILMKRYTFVTRAAFTRGASLKHASTEQLKMTAELMFSNASTRQYPLCCTPLSSELTLSKSVVNSLNYPIYLGTLVLQTTLIIFEPKE